MWRMSDIFDFRTRSERLASETRAQDLATVSELRAHIERLEGLLGYVTAKLLTGQPLDARDAPVLDFFGISDKNPNPLKMIRERVAMRTGRILGRVECPSCGSNVNDVEGVLEETCTFCGATVKTEA